jgi:hypothetical protein
MGGFIRSHMLLAVAARSAYCHAGVAVAAKASRFCSILKIKKQSGTGLLTHVNVPLERTGLVPRHAFLYIVLVVVLGLCCRPARARI